MGREPSTAVFSQQDAGNCVKRDANFVWPGRGFFVRSGSRILRGAWVLFWLGDAGKSIASGSGTVEQGADKAKPPLRGGFAWFHVRTRGKYQLHLYGDRFRESETKD